MSSECKKEERKSPERKLDVQCQPDRQECQNDQSREDRAIVIPPSDDTLQVIFLYREGLHGRIVLQSRDFGVPLSLTILFIAPTLSALPATINVSRLPLHSKRIVQGQTSFHWGGPPVDSELFERIQSGLAFL